MDKILMPAKLPDDDMVRVHRDAFLARKLTADQSVSSMIAELGDGMASSQLSERKNQMAGSLRVTPAISPYVWKLLDAAKRVLHFDTKVDLYVECSNEMNAFCLPLPDGTICVVVSSEVVKVLNPAELLFLFGHELGHAVLRHHELPASALIEVSRDKGCLSPAMALKLLSWSRCAEVSADRYGLLCCQNPGVAARVFIKLASGLPGRFLGETSDYHEQFDEWKKVSEAEDGALQTHPLLPLRVSCCQTFACSEYFSELFPTLSGEAKFTNEEADRRTAEQLCQMDSDPELMDDAEHIDEEREFLALSGLLLICSDGQVLDEETAGVVSISTTQHVAAATALLQCDASSGEERTGQIGRFLAERCELSRRIAIIVKLMMLAAIDLEIAEAETQLLHAFAEALNVPDLLVDSLLQRLLDGDALNI